MFETNLADIEKTQTLLRASIEQAKQLTARSQRMINGQRGQPTGPRS
jgi:hypothetical protein